MWDVRERKEARVTGVLGLDNWTGRAAIASGQEDRGKGCSRMGEGPECSSRHIRFEVPA